MAEDQRKKDLNMEVDDDQLTLQNSSSTDHPQNDSLNTSANESNVPHSQPQSMIQNQNSSLGPLVYPYQESPQNQLETNVDNQNGNNHRQAVLQEPKQFPLNHQQAYHGDELDKQQGMYQSQPNQQMLNQETSDPKQYDLYPQPSCVPQQQDQYQNSSRQIEPHVHTAKMSSIHIDRNPWYPLTPASQQTIPLNFQNRIPGQPVRLPSYGKVPYDNQSHLSQRHINSPPPPYSEHVTNKPMTLNDGQMVSDNQMSSSMESFVLIEDDDENLLSEDRSNSNTLPFSNKTEMNNSQLFEKAKLEAVLTKAMDEEPRTMKLERDTSEKMVSNLIKVSNLPLNETKDGISMFFRKKKITGMVDAKFRVLTYDEGRREAVIEFEDKEVICRLLEKKELEYHGEKITILPLKETLADSDNNPTKQLKVMGFDSSTSAETIDMYFESKKKSGGKAESVNFDHFNDEKYVIVSYDNIEDMDRVLSKEHNLEGCKLDVTKFQPEPVPSNENIVQVTGFTDTSFDVLELYFESKKKSGAEAVKIELDKDENCLYVTYSCNEDMETVLHSTHEIQGNKLKLQKLEKVTKATENQPIIEVTGFKDTSFDVLELYFESKKKSGAEAVKIELNKDENCLYVTYSCNEDMETVLQKTHEIQNNKLKLQKLEENQPIIEVTGFKDTSFDVLELYFESKKKSGAEAVKIELNKDENCLYVTYSCNEECDLILSKEHKIENCQLMLKRYKSSSRKETRKCESVSSSGNDIMVKLSGFKSTLNESKIQNYIENEKKFGAVATSIDFDPEERCVIVTLSCEKDIKKVCGKQHKIGKEEVQVSKYVAPPKWNDRFLIRNISEDTTRNKLKDYLEGKLGCDVINILFSDDEDKAIVYCSADQYESVFSKSDIFRKKKLNDKVLTISPVYKSKIVQVSGFTSATDDEDLENYFENKKKSKGGDVEKVELNEEQKFALVHFLSYEDACNVCQADHELNEVKLKVKEYQKCLGVFGGIEDPDSFVQPEPQVISLDDREEEKLRFIYQTAENQKKFETKLKEEDTVVDWKQDKKCVELKLNLPSHARKGRKLARKWMENHQSYFKDYMKAILYEEFKLITEVIERVAVVLKRPNEKDIVVQVSDSSIIVIGSNTDVFASFIEEINTIISKIETDLDREKKELVETVNFNNTYRDLDTFGIIKMVQDSNDKLKICNSDNKVQFQGIVSEINAAKAFIYEKQESLKTKIITDAEMSPMIMELLLRTEVKKHIIDKILNGNKEIAVWEGNVKMGKETGSLQVIAKDQPSLKKICDIFKETISHVEHQLDRESSHLLTNKKWQIFLDVLNEQYGAFIKIMTLNETRISITCTSDIVECVMEEIKSFFEEHTVYTKSFTLSRGHDLFIKKYFDKDLTQLTEKLNVKLTMDKETIGIKLEGTKRQVQEILESLKQFSKHIECREKNIGEKMHKKLLETEKGSDILNSIEDKLRCVILKEKEELIESLEEEKELLGVFEINNSTIKVIQVDITTLTVDVIVNAANERLKHIGGVAGAIVGKGGVSIQQECDEYVYRNGSVLEGDCMMSNAGNLPCKKIVHAVGPIWSGGKYKEAQKLAEVISRILELVMTHGFKSVAIPAISTGIFNYPVQAATDIIVQSIARHFKKVKRSSITTIYLIDINDKSLRSFIRSLESSGDFKQIQSDYQPRYDKQSRLTSFQRQLSETEFDDDDISGEGAYSLPIRESRTLVQESPSRPLIKPTLITGEIAKVSADVIVNTTSNDLQLQNGAVSSSINKVGGPSLQQECVNKYPNGIKFGDIAVTFGGNLKCKQVYHTCLGQYAPGAEKNLNQLILKCLMSAEKAEVQSIAFPAIGTGNLGYPKDVVAKTFYDTVNEYTVNGGRISNINIVVYGGDAASVKAFKQASQSSNMSIQEPIVRPKSKANDKRMAVLIIGELAKVSADVIVNTTSNDLQLQNGAVSGSINKVGGPSLQQECDDKYPNGIKVGDIAVTSGGNLKCKQVYHTCLGQYAPGAEKFLKQLILDCLISAEEARFQSIAFPAIGTGNLGYPKDVVAKTFYDTVNEYAVNGGRISNINIVVYGGDAASVKAFKYMFQSEGISQSKPQPKKKGNRKIAMQEAREEDWEVVTSSQVVKGIDVGKFKLIVRSGDISTSKLPIIVDSTNRSISPIGAVSKAIYKVYRRDIDAKREAAEIDMVENGIAVTPISSSNVLYIIHVDSDRYKDHWKKAITLCLKEADKLKQHSIAFPALGTGNHGGSMEKMAASFYKALLLETVNMNYLKNVEIVIFKSTDLDSFVNGLTSVLNEKKKSKMSYLRGMVGGLFSYFTGDGDQEEKEMDQEEYEHIPEPIASIPSENLDDISLSFYSDDTSAITKAMEQLDKSIKLEVQELKIPMGDITLTDSQKRRIMAYEESHSVVVKIDERLFTIVIRGLMTDLSDVNSAINSILRNALTKEHEEKYSAVLQDLIQWSWLENGQRKQYKKYANTKIEAAYLSKNVNFSLMHSGQKLEFDFVKMEVKDASGITNPLLRQDKIKEATETSTGLPSTWTIKAYTNLNIVQLNATSAEYQQVESNFKKTLGGQSLPITKIERIENRSVYEQYMAKKKHMELELKKSVEQPILWHGTDQQAVHNINNYGFNRSYCGKNATVHGQGVYFAVSSSYSVAYASGSPGQRQMYQCKVLVGEYALGNRAYRVPPPKPGSSGAAYESVVDNVSSPSMYVIFHDTQAYPEYIITF